MVTMETLLDPVQLTVHLESGEVLEVMIIWPSCMKAL